MSRADQVHLIDLLPQLLSALPRMPSVLRAAYEMFTADPGDLLSIGSTLERNARALPHRSALLCGERRWSHAELNATANRFAAVFRHWGVGHGDVVTLFLDSRPELLITVAALAKLGAVSAPMNTSHRADVLRHAITVAGGRQTWFVVGGEMTDTFEPHRPEQGTTVFHLSDEGIPTSDIDLVAEARRARADNPRTDAVRAGDPFAHVLTSGTTGLPKAVVLPHARWSACARWFGRISLGLSPADVLYLPLPLFHTNGLIVAWGAAAGTGAALALRRRFSASRFWDDVRRHEATAFVYVGELCRYLMMQPPRSDDRRHSVRMMLGNGLRRDIWRPFQQRFGVKRVHEFYGMAEGASVFTNLFNLEGTVGFCPRRFAIVAHDPSTEAPLRDAKGRMRRVAPGEIGLLLSGTKAWAGYTDPTSSAERLVRDVFEPGDEWLNTGDLLRYQGLRHASFVDRLGDTFRWKGENVSASQVEQALLSIPDIRWAAVYGLALRGYDGRVGMATVVARPWNATRVASRLLATLPRHAVPVFVRLTAALETTETFKTRKTDLKREGIVTDDPLHILLPGEHRYQPLTTALRGEILSSRVRL